MFAHSMPANVDYIVFAFPVALVRSTQFFVVAVVAFIPSLFILCLQTVQVYAM